MGYILGAAVYAFIQTIYWQDDPSEYFDDFHRKPPIFYSVAQQPFFLLSSMLKFYWIALLLVYWQKRLCLADLACFPTTIRRGVLAGVGLVEQCLPPHFDRSLRL